MPIAISSRPASRYRVAALALLLWAPTVGMLIWAHAHQYRSRSLVAVLLTTMLLFLLLGGLTRTWRRFFLACYPFFVLSITFVAYCWAFQMPPGHTLSMILAGASWEEARGFAGLEQGRHLTLLLCSTGIYLGFAISLEDLAIFVGPTRIVARIALLVLLPTTVYAAWDAAQLIDGIALNPMAGSLMFLGGDMPRAVAELRGSKVHKVPYHARRIGVERTEEVHVLVIGESVRRASWSLYGYDRTTTPHLDQLKSDLVVLSDAVADANLTEWAVPMLLTGMTPETFSMQSVRGNIADLAKEAGYTTAWLVNQDIGISTLVGITPDRMVYPPDLKSNINGRRAFDEVLLPAFREEMRKSGSARFIGIHMMGSHWEYYRRYPDSFRIFGTGNRLSMLSIFLEGDKVDSDVVDSYDNTVLYTDWFLNQILEEAGRLKVPATVSFFPDHGEDLQGLDGQSGHGQPAFTRHAFEIPAFIWVNAEYERAHPERVDRLRANAAKEIRSHNVFYTLADLMQISWPEAVSSYSAASAQFVPDTEMKHIAGSVLVERR